MTIIWQDLLAALALVLVIEGLMPFIKPEFWRRVIGLMSTQTDRSLRLMGLGSMLMGVVLLYLVR